MQELPHMSEILYRDEYAPLTRIKFQEITKDLINNPSLGGMHHIHLMAKDRFSTPSEINSLDGADIFEKIKKAKNNDKFKAPYFKIDSAIPRLYGVGFGNCMLKIPFRYNVLKNYTPEDYLITRYIALLGDDVDFIDFEIDEVTKNVKYYKNPAVYCKTAEGNKFYFSEGDLLVIKHQMNSGEFQLKLRVFHRLRDYNGSIELQGFYKNEDTGSKEIGDWHNINNVVGMVDNVIGLNDLR